MKKSIFSIACLLIFSSVSWSAYPEVQRAQEAYAEGDTTAMALAIKAGMTKYNDDSVVRKNLLDLYAKSSDDKLDPGWKLPADIKRMTVSVQRMEGEGKTRFRMLVRGRIVKGSKIEQIKITRYPSEVIVDKTAGPAEFEQEQDEAETDFFRLAPSLQNTMVKGGLYFVKIETTQSGVTEGWFLINDEMNSSASPRFHGSDTAFVSKDGRPHFSWNEFFSPEYHKPERRHLFLNILKITADEWTTAWMHFDFTGKMVSVEVGKTPTDTTSQVPLEKGEYAVQLSYDEAHNFGDLILQRESMTSRRLLVDKP